MPAVNELRYDPDQVPEGDRRALLERVQQGARVLDVGCWSGFNGRYLGTQRGAVVDGVEPDAAMAARASRTYSCVHAMTIEKALRGPLSTATRSYDVVLLLDVLEHLSDPAGVMQGLRHVVRRGGTALVSLPNVAHWSVRKELLLGHFRYTSSGLLDATHLHFFTATTGAALLRDAGWEISWRSSSLGPPPLLPIGGRYLRGLRRWPNLFAIQLLYEARVIR